MAQDFSVTISNPKRAAFWTRVFGRTTVHVQSPFPQTANLPGKPNAKIYLLDLNFVTSDEKQRLAEAIAARFGMPVSEVLKDINSTGVPILADDCLASVTNPQKWFS